MEFQDKVLKCIDCGADFVFTAGEQLFFHDKQFKNEPKRCKACKTKRGQCWGTAYARQLPKVETRTTCSECGKETTVPSSQRRGVRYSAGSVSQSSRRSRHATRLNFLSQSLDRATKTDTRPVCPKTKEVSLVQRSALPPAFFGKFAGHILAFCGFVQTRRPRAVYRDLVAGRPSAAACRAFLVFVRDQQRLDLAQQVVGIHRLDQQDCAPFALPVAAQRRVRGQDGHGGIVGFFLAARITS